MGTLKHIKREFGPVYDENSEILILGSFPSVKSREANFFYGHPQNRFWKVLGAVTDTDFGSTKEQKTEKLREMKIALWDVLEECEIIGSSDSSIRNAVPVEIERITQSANIRAIYCNGATAYRLFEKYLYDRCKIKAVQLPSTSPANAAWTTEKLIDEWKKQMSG